MQTSCYKCDIYVNVNLTNDLNVINQFLGNRQKMRFNFYIEKMYFNSDIYVKLK